jgi:hypothetical protein
MYLEIVVAEPHVSGFGEVGKQIVCRHENTYRHEGKVVIPPFYSPHTRTRTVARLAKAKHNRGYLARMLECDYVPYRSWT